MWWDGGDRAITAREKALIEEHGPSSFSIPLVRDTHPQPAELAEQQGEDAVGDQLLDELRDVEDYFNDVEPNPIHLATVKAAIEALAARQPGAQVPVGFQIMRRSADDTCFNGRWDNPPSGFHDDREYFASRPGSYRVRDIYTAPPAQGIDLGQPRPLIARSLAEWHEDDGNVMWWAWCGRDWAGEPAWCGTPNDSDWPGYHTHWTQHPVQPALTDGQRDAAPGVGNG